MKYPSLKELLTKAKNAFSRFPVTLLWCFFGSFFCIWIANEKVGNLFKEYNAVFIVLILGVSWLIATKFFIEQLPNPKKWGWLKVVTLGLLALFYFHLPDLNNYYTSDTYYIRFALYLFAGHLFILFAPFLLQWNATAYWNYLKAITIAIGRSILFSGVLYLGLVLALVAIESLFEFDIKSNRYFQIYIFCLGVVNTWMYVSDFPKKIHQETTIHFNKATEVFVKYILIPLIILYFIILYAYSFKILMQWELPKGWVSYLVMALAFLGFVIEIIIHPVQKKIQSRTINKFHPWFYGLLTPLIVLLFVAIFRRITDYGITENRYFVLVLAFWILGVTMYMLFSKKRQLRIVFLALFIPVMLSSIGPWSAFNVSTKSQINQFKKILAIVVKNDKVASRKEYQQLESILNYIEDKNAVSELNETVGIAINEAYKDTTSSRYNRYAYNMPEKVLDAMGISTALGDLDDALEGNNYFNYYENDTSTRDVNIDGYTSFTSVLLNSYTQKQNIADFSIEFVAADSELILYSKATNVKALIIPIKDRLTVLSKKGNDLSGVDKSLLQIIAKNDSLTAKLIFSELSFYKENDSIKLNNFRAYLFLKKK